MIDLKNFFIDPITHSYYYTGEVVNCSKCNNSFKKGFIMNIKWSKKEEPKVEFLCLTCIKNIQAITEVEQRIYFYIIEKESKKWEQWVPSPPELKDGKPDPYHCKDGELKDLTKKAGRPNYTFFFPKSEKRTIIPVTDLQSNETKAKINNRIEELDNNTDLSYLDDLGKAEVLEYNQEEIKKIENKKEVD